MASLSVVVPIYNVSDYLIACLESLTEQTLDDLEVVLVNDGSTDNSGEMADHFAAGRPGWTVLHVPNGGLGRARNIGMDHSSSPFVAFVDSDDLVPRDAYELMLHAVSESGSDMVCGGVLRYDGARTFTSPLHRRALDRNRMRTHIRQAPALIYDTTAWNKIYRRGFLLAHDLRFPEGVFYEDIPFTLPAHFLASTVDILVEPVYMWRERQSIELSITQRRAQTKNLVDRLAAVSSVDDFLVSIDEVDGKLTHDRKVLTLDIPLFLDVLHGGDDEFRSCLIELVASYLKRVSPATLAGLTPLRRLQYHLISRGMLGELMELNEFQLVPKNRGGFVRMGMRMYADLPFRTDASKAIPASVYEVTRSQPLRTGIRDVRWAGDDLMVDGHAFIHRVGEPHPLASIRRFQLRKIGVPGSDNRRRVRAKRVRRPDLTARTHGVNLSYDAAGFLARIPAGELRLAPDETIASFELLAQIATPYARRGSTVGNPELGRARHPARKLVAADEIALPAYDGRRFRVTVRRTPAVLSAVDFDDKGVTFTLRQTGSADLSTHRLYLRRSDALHARLVPLTKGRDRTLTAWVSAEDLEVRERSLAEREWLLGLSTAEETSDEEPTHILDMEPSLLDVFGVIHGRSVVVRQHGARGALLTETRAGHVVTGFSWRPEGLLLTGITNGATSRSIVLSHSSGASLDLPLRVDETTWTVLVPATGEPGETVLRWLTPGRWRFESAAKDSRDENRPVLTSHTAELQLNEAGGGEGLTYLLRSNGGHQLQLVIDGAGPLTQRGALHRRNARRYYYRLQRRLPLEDTILFESWKGQQYSDNPRAVYEELMRRGDRRRMVWAVTHLGVEVPPGVERVIVGGRDYFRHLARAKWLVSNDSMPTHYVKREGTRYAQTWHGTPLKRIGFDIENLQMSNTNYLTQFAKEVVKWDALVSPNRFSTDILKRAFRFDGDILEVGYPRNDIFYRETERVERVRRTRQRLGLPDGKRVILYAPTWRDNDFDTSGRYLFTMKLDLERLHRAFGDDSILLIRGHQLVASAMDTSMFGGFVRNVSLYPDISDLYLVADVLVTDYSSVMFDFVNTGRPMLFFTWDLEAYRDDLRGFYFDFEREAPGPLLAETEEVIAAIRNLPAITAEYAERYEAFRSRFASLEDGKSSARFIERFLQ